jgi:hypothetical protein
MRVALSREPARPEDQLAVWAITGGCLKLSKQRVERFENRQRRISMDDVVALPGRKVADSATRAAQVPVRLIERPGLPKVKDPDLNRGADGDVERSRALASLHHTDRGCPVPTTLRQLTLPAMAVVRGDGYLMKKCPLTLPVPRRAKHSHGSRDCRIRPTSRCRRPNPSSGLAPSYVSPKPLRGSRGCIPPPSGAPSASSELPLSGRRPTESALPVRPIPFPAG